MAPRKLKDRKPSTNGPRTKKPKSPPESSKTKVIKAKLVVNKQKSTLKRPKKPASNPCPFCPTLLIRSSDVMRHVETHFPETSDTYKCTLCTLGFRQLNNLLQHLKFGCCIPRGMADDPHWEAKRQEAINLAKAKDPQILVKHRFLGITNEDKEFLKDMAALIRQTKEEFDRRAALQHDRHSTPPRSVLPPYDEHVIPAHLRPPTPLKGQKRKSIDTPIFQVASGSSLQAAPQKPKQRSKARRPLNPPPLLPIPQFENTGYSYSGLDDIPGLELPVFDPFHAPRSLRETGPKSYDLSTPVVYPQRMQNFAGPSYAPPTPSSSSVSPPHHYDLYLSRQHMLEEYQQFPFPSSSAQTHNPLLSSGWPFAATDQVPEAAWSFAPSSQVDFAPQYTQESSLSPTFSAGADYGGDNFGMSSASPDSPYSPSPVAYHDQRLPHYDQYGPAMQGAADMGEQFGPPFQYQYPESSLSIPQTQPLFLPNYSFPHSDFSSSYYRN